MPNHRSFAHLAALLLSFALLAAACGGGDDDGGVTATGDDAEDSTDEGSGDSTDDESGSDDEGSGDSTDDGEGTSGDTGAGGESSEDDEPEEIVLTDSWRGVTADTITLGMTMLNFEILQELNLIPNGWGDQQGIWEALIENLNENGGINGRMVEAFYEFYSPIDGADAERACSALTEDIESFANLGGFVGPLAGTADPCIVGLNETTMVGGEINDSELAQARAPWLSVGPPVEFQTINLLNLLDQTGRLDGALVFTMGGAAASGEEDFVIDELENRGVEVVGSAIIEATDGDTVAQDAELAVAFERFKTSGANTLMIFGTPSSSIRGHAAAGLVGEIAIWSNDAAGLGNLGATISDKSIADGVLSSTGPTNEEIWADPAFQSECVDPVVARMPDADLRVPSSYVEGEENWFNPLRRYCIALSLFVQVATAAGGELTPETFEQAAFSAAFDDFVLPGVGAASLSPEKIGAQDMLRLSEYDSTVGDGDLVPVTDLQDAFP